jgi:EAL domain-containing protein (putative c-di-GMP-specific phosphodiesterase class I)
MREPHVSGNLTLQPAAAIGVACAADVESSIDLLRCADIALYHAKTSNRVWVFFDQGMLDALQARKCLEDDLRRALAAGQFDVVYQPIMDPDGRDVVGAEALARWRHPVLGPITPSEFIPLAEESGLIDTLGEWVLRRACSEAAGWPDELFVAVNVSPVQFRQRDFRQVVERVLAETGLDPQRLELEVTETAVFADETAAEQTIMDMRSCGVRMALDDFGTGYSSLIYLRRFAFDKIKIDRSFLESMESTGESATIVHSIVHLGRSLGLTVTAEGIETVEQHRFLQAVGCHEMQGFLFSRPLTPDDFHKLIGADAAPLAASA